MHPAVKWFLVALMAALAALAGLWLARGARPPPLELEHATVFASPRLLPAFSLLDQDGRAFGPDQLRGHWSLLFFGYTQCPDICPTTLATLVAARRELADLPGQDLPQVVLVSIDPARDTPQRLAAYVRFFDPALIGVTGPLQVIQDLTRELGVAVVFGQPDAAGNYTVSHTASLFLVDPRGRLAGLFSTPHSPDGIAHDYRLILAHAEGLNQ